MSIFIVQNDDNYLDVKLKVFKVHDNRDFRLVQNVTMGTTETFAWSKILQWQTDFNQFMCVKNQLVSSTENFGREENLSPVPIPTMSKDMDEQLKLAHKAVDVMNRPNRKICVALLRYSVDKPESSYAQVRLFARKTEDGKFQQIFYVNYELEEYIYQLVVMNSV